MGGDEMMNIWKENRAKEKQKFGKKHWPLSTFPFNELAFLLLNEMHHALFLHKPQEICSETRVQHYLIISSLVQNYTAETPCWLVIQQYLTLL